MDTDRVIFRTEWIVVKESARGFQYLERQGKDSVAVFLLRRSGENLERYEVLIRQQHLCIDNREIHGRFRLLPCPVTGALEEGELPEAAARHSLAVKQVGLTVWAAIVGFGFQNKNPALFLLAFTAFVLFGLLNIYYLYLERVFRKNFNRLSRITGGYVSGEDHQWVEKMQREGRNFLIPDLSPSFLGQLFSQDSVIKSWANLPYLITLGLTIVLLNLPLP